MKYCKNDTLASMYRVHKNVEKNGRFYKFNTFVHKSCLSQRVLNLNFMASSSDLKTTFIKFLVIWFPNFRFNYYLLYL